MLFKIIKILIDSICEKKRLTIKILKSKILDWLSAKIGKPKPLLKENRGIIDFLIKFIASI